MALIQSHYELNVSKHGKHHFATDARSIIDEDKFILLVAEMKLKFPESEGYKVMATKIHCFGISIDH